jgi:hypothetical protein
VNDLIGRGIGTFGSLVEGSLFAIYAQGGGMCVNGKEADYVSYSLGVQIRT